MDSGDEIMVPPDNVRKRKRGTRNECEYARNIIKTARVKGAAYTNWKGHNMQDVKQGDDCKYVTFLNFIMFKLKIIKCILPSNINANVFTITLPCKSPPSNNFSAILLVRVAYESCYITDVADADGNATKGFQK